MTFDTYMRLVGAVTDKHFLIAWHSRTGASEALAMAVMEGGAGYAVMRKAQEVSADELLKASAFLFVCPENLATMSGEMKEMFDRCYYPVLGKVEGRAYATIIAAGSDGEGAQAQIDRIAKGWRLKRIAEHFIVNLGAQTEEQILAKKNVPQTQLERAKNLGTALAEGLKIGIY